MALAKTTELDKMECLTRQFHIIQIREVDVVKDGTEIVAEKFKRRVLYPGYKDSDDAYQETTLDTNEYQTVKDLAADCWTDANHKAYAIHLGATHSYS